MNTSKDLTLLLNMMVTAEVAKRGGSVSVAFEHIARLQYCGFTSKRAGDTLEFTLLPRDSTQRKPSRYADRFIYRLEIVLKYMIQTAPEQRLAFTEEDLAAGVVHTISIEPRPQQLFATIAPKSTDGPKDRTLLFGPSGDVKIFEYQPPPTDKKNLQ